MITLLVFAFFLLARVPIAWTLGISGALGLVLMSGWQVATVTMQSIPYASVAHYSLVILPMYLLMGAFAIHTKIPQDLFRLVNAKFARVPGSLGLATLAACAGLAAVSGSSAAMCAMMGQLAVPEMRKYGYSAAFATGLVAAAGTLGSMIPPSLLLVLYGITAEVSIGKMLLAGFVPGIVIAVCYGIYVYLRARKLGLVVADVRAEALELAGTTTAGKTSAAKVADYDSSVTTSAPSPARARVDAGYEPAGRPESIEAEGTKLPWHVITRLVIIVAIVIMGIYGGFVTVIESGAIAALAVLIMLVLRRRSEGIGRVTKILGNACSDAATTTSMVFAVVVGATIFANFLTRSRIPIELADFVGGLNVPPMLLLILLLLILLVLGCFLDTLAMLLIAVPLMIPIVDGLGFDLIWFGILVVKMMEIGMATPPVGMNIYITAGAAGVKPHVTFRGAGPFILVDLLTVAIFLLFPGLILWLPNLL